MEPVEKAALDPISQIISSLVSLYYVQIYVNNADQLRELDEMFIHWDMAPLFEDELPTGEFAMTFEGDPKDKGGMFVYAFMPAITYNLIRAAALLGEDTYKAMPMRTVPAEARAWDGSVKWEYLAGVLLSYAPERTHLTDAGETPFPSVLDAEVVDGAQQKRWGRRLRKWARKTRDAVRTVVDTVRTGVGELQKLVNKDITLTINMPVKVRGEFAKNQRPWDQFGQFTPTFGQELAIMDTRVNVTQLGGISLFKTKTNDKGVVTVKVPKSRWTHVCIEADSPAARMESGLLWPMRQCFERFRPSASGSRTFTVSMQEFYSLMLMQDARVFSDQVLGHKPTKATVQVGWPADGIGLVNDARPFAPCLEATNGPVSVFNAVVDALTLLGPAGQAAADSVEFVLTSDIVMPSATNRLRVQPVHEYGHFFFCDLINRERSQTFNIVWSQFMTAAFLQRENDVNYMMEGFAEWFSSQVAGGTDYFKLAGSANVTGGSDYLFIPGTPAKGLAMEENVGSALCNSSGAMPFPKCQTTQIKDGQFEDRKEEGMATFATLLHDIIDRKAPRQCAGAGCENERTSSGAVWELSLASGTPQFKLVKAPAGTWGGEKDDEQIELPAKALIKGIRAFAQKNWAFGAALSQENLMVPIIEQMYVYGYRKEKVCELFKLHSRNNTCPSWVPNDPFVVLQ